MPDQPSPCLCTLFANKILSRPYRERKDVRRIAQSWLMLTKRNRERMMDGTMSGWAVLSKVGTARVKDKNCLSSKWNVRQAYVMSMFTIGSVSPVAAACHPRRVRFILLMLFNRRIGFSVSRLTSWLIYWLVGWLIEGLVGDWLLFRSMRTNGRASCDLRNFTVCLSTT